jgi:hypothetical protein
MKNCRCRLLLLSLVMCCTLLSCERDQTADKTSLLPGATPSDKNFSPYQPPNGYAEMTKGLLSRTVFESAGPPGTRIEIRDLFVGPGQSSESASLPGAAVFDVRSGSGSLVHGGQSQEVKTGTTIGISEGESFAIQNQADLPIIIRVNLFQIEK